MKNFFQISNIFFITSWINMVEEFMTFDFFLWEGRERELAFLTASVQENMESTIKGVGISRRAGASARREAQGNGRVDLKVLIENLFLKYKAFKKAGSFGSFGSFLPKKRTKTSLNKGRQSVTY
jgi:hypothetical protein